MAIVDANYKFIRVNVGTYGRSSDGGIFSNSNIGKALAANKLYLKKKPSWYGNTDATHYYRR